MKWFPNNKGLVTGVAVAGFGGGAVLLSFLVEYLLQTAQLDVLIVFRIVGICFGGVALLAALLLSEPVQTEEERAANGKGVNSVLSHIFSREFGFLLLGLFAATFAGLLTVGNLKPILLSVGLSSKLTTLGIALFAVGNAAGRIIWGQIHDRLGSRSTVLYSLVFLGITLIPLLLELPAHLLLTIVTIIGSGFGAAFVVYASSMVENFGTTLFPRLYPVCFLGYGVAGIIGPGTGGLIKDLSGSFMPAIISSVIVVFVAAAIFAIGFPSDTPSVTEKNP